MNLSPAELAVVGTLSGAFVGGLFSAIIVFINKRSEERKHFREIVVKTALENWKHVSQISAATRIPPLTDFVFHMMKMCELVVNKKVNSKNIQAKLHEISELNNIVAEHSGNVSKKVT